MKNKLQQYIEDKNTWRTLAGKSIWDINALTEKDCQELMDSLDASLSPENLSCDGEIRGRELRDRSIYLNTVMTQLNHLVRIAGYKLTREFSEY